MNKLRDKKGRYAEGIRIKKICKNKKCHKEFYVIEALHKRGQKFCSQQCYLNNISGENNPCWRGGLLKQENYRRDYNKKYRHEHGISKKYNDGLGISQTREGRRLYRKRYKYSLKEIGELTIVTIQQVYEDNIKKFRTLTCYLCFSKIIFGDDSIDHKIPISRRKEFPKVKINNKENLGISHISCNCRKHNKTEEEYRSWLKNKEGTKCPLTQFQLDKQKNIF